MEYNLLRFFVGTNMIYEKKFEFTEDFSVIPRKKDIVWIENTDPLRVKQVQWTFDKGGTMVDIFCEDAKWEDLEGKEDEV